MSDVYCPKHRVRIVTATSLFDGHDVAINIIRRILQDTGAEVIHLGHNRSADEVVRAAIQEDAQGIAVTSYQGGHVEFFRCIMDLLRENDASHIRVFGGGGGVILPEEIEEIESYGVVKIYSPEDGRVMGLQGMVDHLLSNADFEPDLSGLPGDAANLTPDNHGLTARCITAVLDGQAEAILEALEGSPRTAPVVGVTGTGGAGKSSLLDELIHRFLAGFDDMTIAVLSVDPTRQKTGGALLGDRLRMNALKNGRVYFRSLATRKANVAIPDALEPAIALVKAAGFDLVFVETAGIGQADAAVAPLVDVALYVMTPDYGAETQLEKIDMLDFADLVALNKFDHPNAEDALRTVRKQYQRNHKQFTQPLEEAPVYGTVASRFNDDGVTTVFHALVSAVNEKTGTTWEPASQAEATSPETSAKSLVPAARTRYLSEVAQAVRTYHDHTKTQTETAEQIWRLDGAIEALGDESADAKDALTEKRQKLSAKLHPESATMLADYPALLELYAGEDYVYHVRDTEFRTPLCTESLSGTRLPRVAVPALSNQGDQLRWLRSENVPGRFPFTAGVFPFKRTDEDPTRMFAGEGGPDRTNRRFKVVSKDTKAKRLSVAFDPLTLYGRDPDTPLDVYSRIGTSGVSICTLEDMNRLFDGFDLCAPDTSVSMTINGPAPIVLAMFFNAAIDQQTAAFDAAHGRAPSDEEFDRIRADVLKKVRGTVQADILKEELGQNTCLFATDFAVRMLGDVQQYFVDHGVRGFYSLSVSGYHMAEAGANAITQLAFTLANGLTYVEYFLARGMDIDAFAPNLSFFFSNGMEAEYSVINRVARRIWAIAMRDVYNGNERSQKLKAHIQTSGRSLHVRDMQFNDIRTTIQALSALYDRCSSLHTNAFDEAFTTPTPESVRRALAIQLILEQEYGPTKIENLLQGSYAIELLTDLVEQAVLEEFARISERGGVLGAIESGYQRGQIQEQSLRYETLKGSGQMPIVGVNTFVNPDDTESTEIRLDDVARADEHEKRDQVDRLRAFQKRHADEAPKALENLCQVTLSGGNVFGELMNTVRSCSLGQITNVLFQLGGEYRRNM